MTKCKFVFGSLATLDDVGGGTGKFARAIDKNFPSIKCTVYDLPHAVANEGGDKNVDFVAGDMFESVPYANAILLKVIKDILPGNLGFSVSLFAVLLGTVLLA